MMDRHALTDECKRPLLSHKQSTKKEHDEDHNEPKSIKISKARLSASNDDECNKIIMKKSVGFVEGTTIVLGIIVGSGIFVSPAAVAVNSGSVGLSLIIWAVCGAFSALGALSFAELGTTIPRSGGDYLYILEVFGPLWAFMRIWIELTVIRPASHAIIALTLAQYLVQVDCIDTPPVAIQCIAILSITISTWVNCKSAKLATGVQNVFTIAKIIALMIVVSIGAVQIAKGHVTNFLPDHVFVGSTRDVGKIILALNAGLWAFCGWNELNYVTDEIRNPARNLPLAIVTSIFLITVLYVSVNLAYFTMLTPSEMIGSSATAVIFGEMTMGRWSICIPVFVALCCFGGINGSIFTSSRLFYIGACEGHLPLILSMINTDTLTPLPSILLVGSLSAVYMVTDDVFPLITYVNFVYYLAMGLAILGLIVLRFRNPDLKRPLKLPLLIHILACLLCFATGILSYVEAPVESGIGTAMVLTSVPVYYLFIKCEKPERFQRVYEGGTIFVQILTKSVAEEIEVDG